MLDSDTYVAACVRCHAALERKRTRTQKFCSVKCRQARTLELSREISPRFALSTGTIGALSELVAAVDLMRRGYHVFRAMSPACPCDLVAMASGVVIRIEVRTGYWTKSGALRCVVRDDERHRHDVMAVVAPDQTVEYRPSLPEAP